MPEIKKLPNTAYETERLILLPFNRESLNSFKEKGITSNYKTWFMDQEVTKYNSHGLHQMCEKDFDDFFNYIDGKSCVVFAVIWKKTNLHVGNISLQSFNWINRSADFAFLLGESSMWGKGIATEAAIPILYHGFDKMNFFRISMGTAGTNIGMQKVAEKLGFIREGRFRSGTFLNGSYEDIVLYSMLEYEWRGNEYRKKYIKN